LLVVVAAGLFVLDVAVRRLTFDTRAAREAAAKAMSRREADTESTVEAWKTARRRAGQKNAKSGDGTVDRDEATARFDVEDGGGNDFSVSSDAAGANEGEGSSGMQRPVKREVSSSESIESEHDAEDMTSRLLRAKRRAAGGRAEDESERSDG
jgi:hypothetical protein